MYHGLISIVVGLLIVFFNKSIAQKTYESDMRIRRKKTDDYTKHSKRYRITVIALGFVFVILGCLDLVDFF